jgi:tRNA_anti-like
MKKILIGIILVGVVTCGVIYLMYNKPHRDPATERSIGVTAVDLFQDFENNELEANARYLDKVVEISGKVTEITANQNLMPIIVLETENTFFGVRCTMNDSTIKAQIGETIILKGICTGYLSDVIITEATIVKN